jgi:putative tryptophan/tyrosine transport system substrate-binding protein
MDHRLTRRQVVQGAGIVGLGLLAGCGRLPGQPPALRVYRLGYLGATALPEPFRAGLAELGYVEHQNLVVGSRDAGPGADRYQALAAELVEWRPDVLVAPGSGTGRALRQATDTIPIVVLGRAGDLLDIGLAASLARPGGNVTGLTAISRPLREKRVQLLKETVPAATRGALLILGEVTGQAIAGIVDVARSVGLELQPVVVRGRDELELAFEAMLRERPEALLVASTPLAVAERQRIVDLVAEARLPVMYELTEFVRAGGLMAYVPRVADSERRAAMYVDKILRGAKPADLPVEQPMTFDFVVNLKTARELGITFPNEILLQVTEVIQ